jgi:hypothetical protein
MKTTVGGTFTPETCPNPECPSKKQTGEEETKEVEEKGIEKQPECDKVNEEDRGKDNVA